MNTDLTPINEQEDDEFDDAWELSQPRQEATSQDGKPVTITAQGLSKYFEHKDGQVKAVDEVNFTFTEGQFITIMGLSGSGKSTLLYILGGLDQATGGELNIDGIDVRRLSERQEYQFRQKRLGFVFQSFHLIPNLTALENVMLPMQLARGKSRAQMLERAQTLLLEVGISEDRHRHKPGKLSGGQQQRVALARCLANDPRVILADEPTGNLDSYSSKLVIQLLKSFAEQEKTVIIVTHDGNIARSADLRIQLADGRVKGTKNMNALTQASQLTHSNAKRKRKKK